MEGAGGCSMHPAMRCQVLQGAVSSCLDCLGAQERIASMAAAPRYFQTMRAEGLKRYREALRAYQEALSYAPNNKVGKGRRDLVGRMVAES